MAVATNFNDFLRSLPVNRSGLANTQQGLSPTTAFGGVMQSQGGTDMAKWMSTAQMGQIEQTAAIQMKFQMEMGQIQMMVKMNEALAKLFKSLGEAVKNNA